MIIQREVCVGCGRCQPFCPAGAISFAGLKSEVDQDRCLECGTCLRVGVCPVGAIEEHPHVFDYPRAVRKFFSDPCAYHPSTGIAGRGTEESKTNDVTGRVGPSSVGLAIEVGRPTVGMKLSEVQKITRALARAGIKEIEANNPIHSMYADPETGDLKPELLGERVLSAIIELELPRDRLAYILSVVKEVAREVDSVFCLDCYLRLEPGLVIPAEVAGTITAAGFTWRPNAKINLGLGRVFEPEERP